MDTLYESQELLDLVIDDVPMLVDGMLSREDKVLCFAAPGVGKSILAQQLASCVASGAPFLGATSTTFDDTHVLYIAGEGDLKELRSRGARMGHSLPVARGRLWYWPVPTMPMNTPRGFQDLMAAAELVHPTLTIFDPIYSLIAGSMRDDDRAGDFLRNLHHFQHLTQSAILLMHHTHRPVKDKDGDIVDEGDGDYFGSMLWQAWARTMWAMRVDGPSRHYVSLKVVKDRNRVSSIDRRELMLVEPDPLMFVERDSTLGPTQRVIVELLVKRSGTLAALEEVTKRSKSTVSDALTALVKSGKIVGNGERPEQFTLVGG